MVKNNKKLKNYLHRGSYTPCGNMTHKENHEQRQKCPLQTASYIVPVQKRALHTLGVPVINYGSV